MHRHANVLTSVVLKGDEGRDRRCLDNSDRVYLSPSVAGSQKVDKKLVFESVLLDVCRQTSHPHSPVGLCHLLGEAQTLLGLKILYQWQFCSCQSPIFGDINMHGSSY